MRLYKLGRTESWVIEQDILTNFSLRDKSRELAVPERPRVFWQERSEKICYWTSEGEITSCLIFTLAELSPTIYDNFPPSILSKEVIGMVWIAKELGNHPE